MRQQRLYKTGARGVCVQQEVRQKVWQRKCGRGRDRGEGAEEKEQRRRGRGEEDEERKEEQTTKIRKPLTEVRE